jgi:LPS-assembly protein
MRNHWFILISFFILLLLTDLAPLQAKVGEVSVMKETRGEGPVDIEADELIYDRESQTYQAHGQVEVSRGDLSLKSDHAQLNMGTKELAAWGNVLLREGEDVIECQRLEVNIETRLGKNLSGQALFEGSEFSYHRPRGREIRRKSLSIARWLVDDLRCETTTLEIYRKGNRSERDGFGRMGNSQRAHLLL